MANHTVRFAETQYFRQWWLWLMVAAPAVVTIGLFAWGLYVQLVQGQPWGEKPMSDTWLIITAVLVFLFDFALVALFRWGHLRTEVRDDGLYFRFFPFHLSFHRLPLVDVSQVEAVTYRPVMEYGGYGIRYSFGKNGKAYNVSGNRGVRLDYTTGRHLLLGSQQPDQLATAIEALREEGGGR